MQSWSQLGQNWEKGSISAEDLLDLVVEEVAAEVGTHTHTHIHTYTQQERERE